MNFFKMLFDALWTHLALLSLLCVKHVADIECNDAYSCSTKNLISNSEEIHCYGFFSCGNNNLSAIIHTGTSLNSIQCYASYACYGVSIISRSQKNSGGQIQCYGLYSCSNVDMIYNYNGAVYCIGELSCFESIFYLSQTETTLNCLSDHSCSNSIIHGGKTINITGAYGAQNSIFYTNDSIDNYYSQYTTIEYYFYGMFSGYNSTIICDINTICNITCHANACNNINLISNNSTMIQASNGMFQINCENSEMNNICPQSGYETDNTITTIIPNLNNNNNNNISLSSLENSFYPCNNTENSYNCGNYDECNSYNFQFINDNSNVCCTGYDTCRAMYNITISKSNNNGLIRCDSYAACSTITNINSHTSYIISHSNINSNIYFTGYLAGSSSTIYGKDGITDIYCTGYKSCDTSIISYSKNIYCTGESSCEITTIKYVNNIFGYGYASIKRATIKNVYNNIYCISTVGCQLTTITNVFGSIYGNGNNVFEYSTIKNVYNNLYGFGRQSLANTEISNVVNVICYSEESCQNADISNVYQIVSHGYNALSGAKITSDFKSRDKSSLLSTNPNRTLIISVNDTIMDDSFELICNINDTCIINCQEFGICINVSLNCNNNNCIINNCRLNCTNSPTMMPTTIPNITMTTNTADNGANSNNNNNGNDDDSEQNRYIKLLETILNDLNQYTLFVIIGIGSITTIITILAIIYSKKPKDVVLSYKQDPKKRLRDQMKGLKNNNNDDNNNQPNNNTNNNNNKNKKNKKNSMAETTESLLSFEVENENVSDLRSVIYEPSRPNYFIFIKVGIIIYDIYSDVAYSLYLFYIALYLNKNEISLIIPIILVTMYLLSYIVNLFIIKSVFKIDFQMRKASNSNKTQISQDKKGNDNDNNDNNNIVSSTESSGNEKMQRWLMKGSNNSVFAIIYTFSVFNIGMMQLLISYTFNYYVFCVPFSIAAIRYIKISSFYSIILQVLPQLVIQCYVYYKVENTNFGIIEFGAIFVSMFGIVHAIATFVLFKQIS